MSDVISIKFKNRGKSYYFDPRGLQFESGEKVVVETSKGLELADVSQGNHEVDDSALVQPLRPVARKATPDDLRVAEINKRRESEAFAICREKIAEHKLEMKLVDVECSFEGNKITFFFTADGRVDFRDLVRDLAGIFRNRIELRQIGVRDEAKMVGGIAICGRPYCCGQFLDDFQPVSTKMAKVQSLSLNPTKISGSCGRLMCCLRYEQDAYEDLTKKVPKQGAFVETKDGFGTAVQVNLLRQSVKVRLDGDNDDTLHVYKANELCTVPGGRPRDGSEPPHVLHYVPEPEEEETEDEWQMSAVLASDTFAPNAEPEDAPAAQEGEEHRRSRRGRRGRGNKPKAENPAEAAEKAEDKAREKRADEPREDAETGKSRRQGGRNHRGKVTVKPVKLDPGQIKLAQEGKVVKAAEPKADKTADGDKKPSRPHRRRRPRGPKPGGLSQE